MENIIVGISEYKIVKYPNQITTVGLGSCCGVVIYDEINKIAGLVHILLSNSKYEINELNKAKYADTGIIALYEELKESGANPRFLKAKIAGGAHMFNSKNFNNESTIGEKNVKACKNILAKLNISIVSEDTLGYYGRTIIFDTVTNNLKVKCVGKREKII